MIDDETKRKLRLMQCDSFVDIYDEQVQDPECRAMSFDDRFTIMVDRAYQKSYNDKVLRRIKQAKLRFPNADVHDIYYDGKRPVTRDIVNEIATCDYVDQHTCIALMGYASSGKTYLSCAFAKEACKKLHSVRYIREADLMNEFAKCGPDNRAGVEKLIKKYAKYDLLVLDEWLTNDINMQELNFLNELIERRYDSTSTIFCTLYPQEDWVVRLGKGTLAESIVERIRYITRWIETGDINMRKIYSPFNTDHKPEE